MYRDVEITGQEITCLRYSCDQFSWTLSPKPPASLKMCGSLMRSAFHHGMSRTDHTQKMNLERENDHISVMTVGRAKW